MSTGSNSNSAASSPRHLTTGIGSNIDSTPSSASAAATSNPSSRAASAGASRAKAQFLAKQEAVARTKEKIAAKQAAEKAAKKAAIQAANGTSAIATPSSRDLDAEAIALRKKMIIEQEMALAAEKEALKKQTVNANLAALKAKKEKTTTTTTSAATSSAAKKKAVEEAERARVQAEAEAAAAAAYAAAQAAEEQRVLLLQKEQQRQAEEEEAARIAAEEEDARLAAEEEFAEAERLRLEQEEAEAVAAQAAAEVEERRRAEAQAGAARLMAEQAEAAALAARAAARALELKKQQERLEQEEKARAAKLAQAKALALERKKKQQAEAAAAAAEVERIRKQREEEEAAAAAEEVRLFAQEEAAVAATAASARRRAQEQEDAEVAEAVTLAAERARFDEEQALEAEAQAEREFHDRLKSNQLESERLAHKKRLQLEQMRKLKQQQQEIDSSRSVSNQQQDLKQNLSPSSRRSTAPAPHISSSPAMPSNASTAAAVDPMAVDASALAYAQARREELREEARKKRRELEEALAAERDRQLREAEEMAMEEASGEFDGEGALGEEQLDEHSFVDSATGDESLADEQGDDEPQLDEDDEGGFDVVRASKIGGFTSAQQPRPHSGRSHHVAEEKEFSFKQQQSNLARQSSAPFNRTMKKSSSTAGAESPLRQSLSRSNASSSPSHPKPTPSSFVQPSPSDFGRMDRPLTAPHRNFSTAKSTLPSPPSSNAANLNPLRHSIAPGVGHNNSFNSYKNPQSDAWMEESSSDVVLASELARLQALQDELSMQNMKVRMLKQKAASKDQEKLIKKRITGIVGTPPRPAGQKLEKSRLGGGGQDQPAGALNIAADLSPSAPVPAQSPPFKPNPDAHLGDTLTKAISSASKQARLLHEEVENEMGGVAVPTVKSSGKNTPRSVLRQPRTTAAAVLMDPQNQHADLSGTHSFPAHRDHKQAAKGKSSSRQSELKARFDAAEDNDDDFEPSAVQFSTSSILRKEGKPFVSQQLPPPSTALYSQHQEDEIEETEEEGDDESPFEPQNHMDDEDEDEDTQAEETLSKKFEAVPLTVTMGKQAFARQAQVRAQPQKPAASQITRKAVNVVRADEQDEEEVPSQKFFTHAQPTAVGANRSTTAATLRAEKRQTAPANVGAILAQAIAKPQPPMGYQPTAIPTYAQYNPNAADNDSPRSTVSSASTSSSPHPRKKWAKEAALLHSPVIAQTVQDSMALNRSVFIQHPAVKEIVALEAQQRQQQQPQPASQRGVGASPAFASPPPASNKASKIDSQATPPGIAAAVQQAAANAKVQNQQQQYAPVVPKHAGPVRNTVAAAAAISNLPTQKITQPVVPPIRSTQYNDPSLPIQLGPHSHRSLFSTVSNAHQHRPASPAATESDNLSVFERQAYSESPQRSGNSALTNASSPTHSVKSTASAWSATLSLSPSVNSAGVALDPENVHLSAEELLELERRQRRKIADLKEREAKSRAKKELRKQQEEAAAAANAAAAGLDFSSPASQFHRRVSSGGQHSSPQGAPAPGLYSSNAGLNGKAATIKPSSTAATAAALSAAAQPADVKAATGTATAAVAKKKVNILKQPENYGQRFEMQQQQQGAVNREKGGIQAVPRSTSSLSNASAGVPAGASAAATAGPSLDELDEELKQMQEEEEMEQAQQVQAPASKKTRPGAVVAPLSKPSNRQLLLNAIQHVCLAGATMSAMRNAVVAELKASPGEHFLILLKQERALTFKALYLCNLDTQQAMKLFGEGPELIDSTMIQTYFKYDSAAKQFKEIPAERLTPTSAAVVLIPTLQRKARSIKK